jgi:hypothetical protein
MRIRRTLLVPIALVLALTGGVRLGAQGYTAMAQALSARFEGAVALFTAAQQTRFADMTARLRQEIADLKARAADLDDRQAKLEAARRRVTTADSEWRSAKATSDSAVASIEKRATEWGEETKQFLKALGDFHERWGLPREVDGERMVPKAQYDQYQREYAPYRQRSAELDARMNKLKAEGPQVKMLQGVTIEKANALGRAKDDVSALEATQSAKAAEFEAAKAKCEADVRTAEAESKTPPPAPPSSPAGAGSGGATPGGAGSLTPFPGSAPRQNMPLLVRPVAGVVTTDLDRLRGIRDAEAKKPKADFMYDCFTDGCAPSGGGTDVVVAAPPAAVAQHILNNPKYQEVAAARAAAEQNFAKADSDLRAAMRNPNTPPAELQSLFKVQTEALKVSTWKRFEEQSFIRNLSFGINTSSQAPKPAASGNASPGSGAR